jgi:beta-xylosidase
MKNSYLLPRLETGTWSLIVFSSIFFLSILHSKAQISNQPGTNGIATYINAVQPEDNPDQTLLKVGNDFYSTGSSFHFTPYVSIRHSTDLVHWEVISRVVPSNWSGLSSDATSAGIWQGALANFGGYFWVYYSNSNSGGQYFSKATSMTGPWSAPARVTASTVTGYDNSIFVDDDGTPYMLMKNGQAINRIQQIDKNTGQLTGTLMNMDWINANNRYSWAEGPVMCKRNGRYYYFMAGDVSGGQYCMSSATLTATESSWTLHGNFFSTATSPGGFTGPNHISQPVQIADGTWWCLSHAYDNSGWYGQGRQSLLHQVIFDANDVPHGVPPSTNPVAAPNLPSSTISINLPRADYFTSTSLGMNWHFFNKTNATKYSLTANTGYMRLTPGTGTTHILQKEGGHYYSMVTKVNLNATASGNQAGLRIMNGKDNLFATLYTGYNGGQKIGFAFNGTTTEVNNTIGNVVWLKIERSLHTITGFYSADGIVWTQIGGAINISTLDNYSTNYNEWVGTSIGLYATGTTADFDSFMYRDGLSPIKVAGHNNHYGVTTSTKTPGSVVSNSITGDWLVLAGVQIGHEGLSAGTIQVNAASASGTGSLEVWIDNIGGTGTQIATIPITSSGGADVWKDYTASINASGQHDVYLRWVGAANSFSVNTIRFLAGTTCAASITSGGITTFCSGGSVVLATSTGTSYKWMNGTTQVGTAATYTATTTGSYTVEVTNANNCKATSAVTVVTVNPLPTATISTQGATNFCQGSGSVTLNANTGTGLSYQWLNGTTSAGTGSASLSLYVSSGTFTVKVTDANGCAATSSPVVVTATPTPTAPTVTATAAYCQNATAAQLTATGTGLKWYADNTTTTVLANAPTPITTATGTTNYYVSQTLNGCESPRATLAVTVNASPAASVTAGAATTFCSGGSVLLTSSAGSSYVWKNGTTQVGTGATYTATAAGSYTVEVTNATNCKATSAATVVTVNTPPAAPTVTATAAYCQNATTTQLTATGSSLKWYADNTTITALATAPIPGTSATGVTNYYVSQSTTGCESPRAQISVTVNALPTAVISPAGSTTIPAGGSVVLNANTGSGLTYKWFNGNTQVGTGSSYVANAVGSYAVEVTNASGCKTTSLETDVHAAANQPSVITITSPAPNSSTTLPVTIAVDVTDPDGTIVLVEYLDGNTVIGTSTSSPYSFDWTDPGEGNHVITVRVTDSNGGITTSAPVTITTIIATATGVQSSRNTIYSNVYPIPARDEITVETDIDLTGATFSVVNILGQEVVLSVHVFGTDAKLDVSALSAGTYVLFINKDSTVISRKISIVK